MNELLKQLTEIPGVSGDEKEVRKAIKDLIEPHVDEWWVDAIGNLVALKKGTGESDLRFMLDAHMDEVGFLITDVMSDGTFKFDAVGGFDDRVLQGKMLQVGPRKVTGVIGGKPVHLSSASERRKIVPKSSLRINPSYVLIDFLNLFLLLFFIFVINHSHTNLLIQKCSFILHSGIALSV